MVLTIVGTLGEKGTVNPVETKIWIKEIKKIFEIFGVEDNKKTIFDAYMLNG